jgi:hypothetical protein
MFTPHPVGSVLLSEFMKPEIALILTRVHQIATVGNFLDAWRNPKKRRELVECFDTSDQAACAAQVMMTWFRDPSTPSSVPLQGESIILDWYMSDIQVPVHIPKAYT